MAGENAHERVGTAVSLAEGEVSSGATTDKAVVATGADDDVAKRGQFVPAAQSHLALDDTRSLPGLNSSPPLNDGVPVGRPRCPVPQPDDASPDNHDFGSWEGLGGEAVSGFSGTHSTKPSSRRMDEQRATDGEGGRTPLFRPKAARIAPPACAVAGLGSSPLNAPATTFSSNSLAARKPSRDGWSPLASPKDGGERGDPTNAIAKNVFANEDPAVEFSSSVAHESDDQGVVPLYGNRVKGVPSPASASARSSLVDASQGEICFDEERGVEARVAAMVTTVGVTVVDADATDVTESGVVRGGADRASSEIRERQSEVVEAVVAVAPAGVAVEEPFAGVTLVRSFVVTPNGAGGTRPDIVLSASSDSEMTFDGDDRSRTAEAEEGGSSDEGLVDIASPLPVDVIEARGRQQSAKSSFSELLEGSVCNSTAGSRCTASSVTTMERKDQQIVEGMRLNRDMDAETREDLFGVPGTVKVGPIGRESATSASMISTVVVPGSVHADDVRGQAKTTFPPGKAADESERSSLEAREAHPLEGVNWPAGDTDSENAVGGANSVARDGEGPDFVSAVERPADGDGLAPADVDEVTERIRAGGGDTAIVSLRPISHPPRSGGTEKDTGRTEWVSEESVPRLPSRSGSVASSVYDRFAPPGPRASPILTEVTESPPEAGSHLPAESTQKAVASAVSKRRLQRRSMTLEELFPSPEDIGDNHRKQGSHSISVEEAAAFMGANPCSLFASGLSWATVAGKAGALVPADAASPKAHLAHVGPPFETFVVADPRDFISPAPDGSFEGTRARRVGAEFVPAPMLSPGDPLRSIPSGAAPLVSDDTLALNEGFGESRITSVVEEKEKGPVVALEEGRRRPIPSHPPRGDAINSSPCPVIPLTTSTGVAVPHGKEGSKVQHDLFADSQAPVADSVVALGATAKSLEKPAVDREAPTQPVPSVWSVAVGANVGGETVTAEGDSEKIGDGHAANFPRATITGELSMIGDGAGRAQPGHIKGGGCCSVS